MNLNLLSRNQRAGIARGIAPVLAALTLPICSDVTQQLHYGAVPFAGGYQLGSVGAVSDIPAPTSDGQSGTVKISSPYRLSSNSSETRRILVKVMAALPEGCAIHVDMDQPPGLQTQHGGVDMDVTDRNLVTNLDRGNYQGTLHYAIQGDLSKAKNSHISVLYTLSVS